MEKLLKWIVLIGMILAAISSICVIISMIIAAAAMNAMAINVDVWNKISPEDQKAIEEIAAGTHDWFVAEMDKEAKKLDAFYKENSVEIIKFSPEEEARIIKMCTDAVWSDWLSTAEKQGVPGKEFLDRYRAKISELSK